MRSERGIKKDVDPSIYSIYIYMEEGPHVDFTSSSKLSWAIMEDAIQEGIRHYSGIKNKEKWLCEYW